MTDLNKIVEDLRSIGLEGEARKIVKEQKEKEQKEEEIESIQQEMVLPSRSQDQIDRAKEQLEMFGEDMPKELKYKLQTISRPPQPNITVEVTNWFGKEYKDEYKRKVNSYKTKDWMEKIKERVRREIEEEMFNALLETQSSKEAMQLVTENQLRKIGYPEEKIIQIIGD